MIATPSRWRGPRHWSARPLEFSAETPAVGEPDPRLAPWPGHYVETDGIRLFVRTTPATAPDAEPALYVHGLGGASTNFTDVAALLSPWLDGESIDLAGFGRSDPARRGGYGIRAQAGRIVAYLQAAGRGPVHLIGNSMGGAIAIAVAAMRPDLVRTLTLISPAVPDFRIGGADRLAMQALLLPLVSGRVMRKIGSVSPEVQARGVLSVCFARPERVPANRFDEAVEEIVQRRTQDWADTAFVQSVRAIAANYLGVGSRSPWRWMASITAPTLVIWGSADQLVAVKLAARVAATIPDAQLLVLDDVGHTAQLEDPAATARAILTMITRANPGRRASDVTVFDGEPSERP